MATILVNLLLSLNTMVTHMHLSMADDLNLIHRSLQQKAMKDIVLSIYLEE